MLLKEEMGKTNRVTINTITDWLVVFFNITYHLSIIKVYTFDLLPIQPYLGLLVFTTICYCYRFGRKVNFQFFISHNIILSLFFLIYTFDVFQVFMLDPLSSLLRLITALDLFIFGAYLMKLWDNSKAIDSNILYISKPYICFCVYNVFIVIFVAILIKCNIISPETNQLAPNSVTKVNVAEGQTYFFPYYLSITAKSFRILGDFGLPMITGLSHEPHVLNYIVLPSLFLIMAIKEWGVWKFFIYASYLALFVINFSTTALMALGAVLFADLIWLLFVKRNSLALIPIAIVIILVVLYANPIVELASTEVLHKTDGAGGSLDYSSRMLNYMIHPTSIIGAGNMPGDLQVQNAYNIGLVTFLLDFFFLIFIIMMILKISFSNDRRRHYIGLACMYVLVHSLKVNMLALNYPYFGYIVLILSIYFSNYRQTRLLRKMKQCKAS